MFIYNSKKSLFFCVISKVDVVNDDLGTYLT